MFIMYLHIYEYYTNNYLKTCQSHVHSSFINLTQNYNRVRFFPYFILYKIYLLYYLIILPYKRHIKLAFDGNIFPRVNYLIFPRNHSSPPTVCNYFIPFKR